MDQIEQLCCEHEHDVEGQTMLLVYLGSLLIMTCGALAAVSPVVKVMKHEGESNSYM